MSGKQQYIHDIKYIFPLRDKKVKKFIRQFSESIEESANETMSYEDYVEEKVKYFVSLANLSYKVTGNPAQSIPYLDEALIAIDGEESSYPYIDRAEIKKLRDHYRSLVG